jgi:hypothetical protein
MERMIMNMFQPGTLGLLGLVFLLPLIKGLLIHEKKAWLNRLISDSNDESTKSVLTNTLTEYSNNSNKHSIYQFYKFQLGLLGIGLIITGILTLLSDLQMEIEVLIFLPLVFGAAIFGVYATMFKNSGVWREIGAGSLFLGFAVTFIGLFPVFKLDFMRLDIVFLIVLFVGLLLYKVFKSNAVTYLFMLMIIGSPLMIMLQIMGGYSEWLSFLMLMPWLFLGAMFYLWIPRLESAKCLGMVEVAFGVLLAVAALTLSYSLADTLSPLVWGVTAPLLYIISKKYYSQGHWLVSKPIQLIVAGSVIFTIMITAQGGTMLGVNSGYVLFKGFTLSRVIMYAIIAGLGYAAYLMYDKLDESKAQIDNLILLFPPLFAILAWFGDWGSSYVVLAYGIILGYSYLTKGLEDKDELFVVVGSSVLLSVVLGKLSQFVSGGWLTTNYAMALFLFVIGGLVLSFMIYLRGQWSVSDEVAVEMPTMDDIKID